MAKRAKMRKRVTRKRAKRGAKRMLEGILSNPPKDEWIPVHAVKFLSSGLIKLMK